MKVITIIFSLLLLFIPEIVLGTSKMDIMIIKEISFPIFLCIAIILPLIGYMGLGYYAMYQAKKNSAIISLIISMLYFLPRTVLLIFMRE